MKKHGMCVEIKYAKPPEDVLIIQLSKYNGINLVDTKFEIDITDYRIERGLFELEIAIMKSANLKPAHGVDAILEALQKNKYPLPHHNYLREEVMQNGNAIRISFMGAEPSSKADLYRGSLHAKDEIVVSGVPQKKIRYIMDDLENALLQKRRDEYRKGMNDIIDKLNNTPSASE